MMGWYGGGAGWSSWFGVGLFWLLLLGMILFLVVQLLPGSGQDGSGRSSFGDGSRAGSRSEPPEEILDRRFAQGEIDIESYQVQRAALVQMRGKK